MAAGLVVAGALAWFVLARPSSGTAEKPRPVTFGDLMHPMSTEVLGPDEVKASLRTRPPKWGDREEIRWDRDDVFTYSLPPQPLGTHFGGLTLDDAAEFFLNNSVAKGVDVRFVVTGRRFAIHYKTYRQSEARVWLDGRPVSKKAFWVDDTDGRDDWLVITLPKTRTVTVRFEGPTIFSGVEHSADEPVTVKAAKPEFTIGVVSDSMYEPSPYKGSISRSAAPTLATLTGFRVWNMAQSGTGYLNAGLQVPLAGYFNLSESTRYGSEERLQAIDTAPIDALLVNGSLNDSAMYSADAYRDAVDRFLTAVEMRLPTTPIVIVGVEPISSDTIPDHPTPMYLEMTDVLRQAAAEHDNVVGFIDPYTDNWLTGTGSAKHPRGDGNQDKYIGPDGIHPNGRGQVFYQRRVVEQLRTLPVNPRDAHPAGD
ncbi:SGNH/GDSL hydrolase family protein [Aeromicrobium terrae]|uniref:SGNH/GDSL hydrolase family protein n=1 Tax=Aeromicrobium terrae TaxID=2498846 RepID=A0A5C8NHQ2_9ACTN|nr:SGNH/GDSL hydrolase family protein [Aeromicrobium terrae]TXL60606.1 SGNH/GDSL hydrolase family protein [Aeromicrobium terrae]